MNQQSKNLSCFVAIIALVLLFTQEAHAQSLKERWGKRAKTGQSSKGDIIKELNLTQEQQQQITEQRGREKEQYLQLRQQIKATQQEITDELDKDITDKTKIEKLVAQMKELYGRRIQHRVEGILALKRILTPEQFRTLNEKTKRFKRGGRYEKTSHNGYYHSRFGYGCKRPKFCQRLG
jgi:Spy/CpxP family protein refolding chaperone